MAEDLADYLKELGVKVQYLHSEVDTLERVAILRDLRLGVYDVLVGINLLREGIDLPEVTLVAILDADKEGFLRSAWSLIQMIGRAARNTGGEVVMYADRSPSRCRWRSTRPTAGAPSRRPTTWSTASSRRPSSRRSATSTSGCGRWPRRPSSTARAGRRVQRGRPAKVEKMVAQMEAEMKAAAKQLEFERAAALRDEIQQIRLRVLEQDASMTVGRAAERAGRRRPAGAGLTGAAERARGRRGAAAAVAAGPAMEVTSVDGAARRRGAGRRTSTASRASPASTRIPSPTGCPGIRDEHDDEAGWQARWLDRPTWDRTVTPNILKRTGQRPGRRR